MTTYRCAACSTILETEKLDILNIVEVKPCEACIEAAEEAAEDKGFQKALLSAIIEEEVEDSCEHEWVGLHGHPAVFECEKCKKLTRGEKKP